MGSGWLLFNTELGFHRFDLKVLSDQVLDPERALGFVALDGANSAYEAFYTTATGLFAFSHAVEEPASLLEDDRVSEVTADQGGAYILTKLPGGASYFQRWDFDDGENEQLFAAQPLWEVWAESGTLYWAEGDSSAGLRWVFAATYGTDSARLLFEYSGWGQLLVDRGQVLLASRADIRRYSSKNSEILVSDLEYTDRRLVAAAASHGNIYWLEGTACSNGPEGARCLQGELWRSSGTTVEKLSEFEGEPLTLVADGECVYWSVRSSEPQRLATALFAAPR